ncbi:hypothetical protein PACTADRAFT_43863 [Pachysolen tannophilus NRRL Y-2460]|uniref:Nudix hydrolase domain-containing protein n=1 Tax=Pachysolen tannophilus NRRL Y-2460 TaxID=669874 RepID=A0A1E4TSK7_PACTA|nr:hypothetical protein PACTADRAFT_43863 [Pachysolen tannophilus NRRL Y-2460]
MESEFLQNIANYKPRYFNNSKVSIWHKLPISRRSAVLVILFLGKSGELRVVLSKRSRKLRSFPGNIALPGGRADTGLESEWQTARRETEEEIGISQSDLILKEKFGCSIDQINLFPCYLSRTFLAVTPCIGFLKWSPSKLKSFEDQHISSVMLNPGESSSIFSVPLKDFLQPKPRNEKLKECLKSKHITTKWGDLPWQYRSFIFPIDNPNEVKWLDEVQDLSSSEEETAKEIELNDLGEKIKIRDVWGLTANILHDLADITYNGSKAYDKEIGEEELLNALHEEGGQLSTKQRTDYELKMMNHTSAKNASFKEYLSKETFQKLQKIYNGNVA